MYPIYCNQLIGNIVLQFLIKFIRYYWKSVIQYYAAETNIRICALHHNCSRTSMQLDCFTCCMLLLSVGVCTRTAWVCRQTDPVSHGTTTKSTSWGITLCQGHLACLIYVECFLSFHMVRSYVVVRMSYSYS